MVTQSQNIAKDAEFYGRGFVYIVTFRYQDVRISRRYFSKIPWGILFPGPSLIWYFFPGACSPR